MADPYPTTLTAGDIQALADRLLSRGTSRLFVEQPELQSDLRLAALVIRALLQVVTVTETLIVVSNNQA